MKRLIVGLLVLGSFSIHASDLREFCKNDHSGELYSEIIDSDIVDGFVSIGLDPNTYKVIISKNPNMDLFELAGHVKLTNPEIDNALTIWKLNTCIDRGYDMLTGVL